MQRPQVTSGRFRCKSFSSVPLMLQLLRAATPHLRKAVDLGTRGTSPRHPAWCV